MRETPPLPEPEREASPEIREDITMLESSLQELLTTDIQDIEEKFQRVKTHADQLKAKYGNNVKFGEKLEFIRGKLKLISGTASLLAGLCTELLTDVPKGMLIGTGVSFPIISFSLTALTNHKRRDIAEKASQIKADIEILLTKSRELSDAYLKKGGAEEVEGGRLEVTGKQVEKAREEMNRSL